MKLLDSHINEGNFALMILGRNLLSFTDHYIIRFTMDNIGEPEMPFSLHYRPISLDNVSDCEGTPLSLGFMRKYLIKQPDYVGGYVFYTETNEPVGCIWLMYKGGNEIQYKVRNIDVLGFNFCVYDEYRGKGCIKYMIYCVLKELSSQEIDALYAGVRKNNTSALKAYRKAGAEFVDEKRFFRILRINIPYHKL